MKLLITHFSATSCHFISLRFKYSLQQRVLKYGLCSSHIVKYQVSHPQKIIGKSYSLVYFNFYIFMQQT
jgi:hypothetical protein